MDFKNSAGILLLFCIAHSDGGSYCGISNLYCDDGCCDDGCCQDGKLSTTEIIGLVIGAIIGLATLVGCIVCVLWMCKNANRDRHAVQPYHNTNSVYVHNNPYDHPRPGPPPSYNQHYGYPTRATNPHYNNYNNSVYPPGMVQGNQSTDNHPPPSYTASNNAYNK